MRAARRGMEARGNATLRPAATGTRLRLWAIFGVRVPGIFPGVSARGLSAGKRGRGPVRVAVGLIRGRSAGVLARGKIAGGVLCRRIRDLTAGVFARGTVAVGVLRRRFRDLTPGVPACDLTAGVSNLTAGVTSRGAVFSRVLLYRRLRCNFKCRCQTARAAGIISPH